MAELSIEVDSRTDVGRKRSHNEDSVGCFEPANPEELARSGRLYVVADGVGGGAAGEVASKYTVGKVLYEYYRSTEPDLVERLKAAIRSANADIYEHVQRRPELDRMGTTIVAAAVRGDELVVANVGDSRAYLIRGGEIRQITRDHSLVAKLIEEGSITPEEAEHHPKRNVLLRSIGVDPDVCPHIFEDRLQPGDQVVLCSDGLTRYVSDAEILEVATRTRLDRAIERFVKMANERGGKDNISVMLVRAIETALPPALPEPATAPRMPVQPAFDTIHDTISRRRRAPRRPLIPGWAWLALSGAAGLLLLVGVLSAGKWNPGFLSPLPTLADVSGPTSSPAVEVVEPSVPTVTPTLLLEPRPPSVPLDTPSPSPSESDGLVGQIVFTGGKSGTGFLAFVLDVKKGNIVRAPIPPGCDTKPRDNTSSIPSPDGNWNASIQSSGELWIASTDGNHVYPLTQGRCAADPVWSPNSRYIAFISLCPVTKQRSKRLSEFSEIWIIPAPGTVSEPQPDLKDAGHIAISLSDLEQVDLKQIHCWIR